MSRKLNKKFKPTTQRSYPPRMEDGYLCNASCLQMLYTRLNQLGYTTIQLTPEGIAVLTTPEDSDIVTCTMGEIVTGLGLTYHENRIDDDVIGVAEGCVLFKLSLDVPRLNIKQGRQDADEEATKPMTTQVFDRELLTELAKKPAPLKKWKRRTLRKGTKNDE